MSDLLKERSIARKCQIDGEGTRAFLSAVLDLSGNILAFLDADRHPILYGKDFTSDLLSSGASETCPVNDKAGNLLGFIVRKKRNRDEDRDFLTGTAGRARLEEEFTRRIASLGAGRELTLLFVDLDRFKPVNELFGHLVGDQVLLQFAVLLKNSFRSGDCVARYGGDEFVILCGCPVDIVQQRVDQFRRRLASLFIEVTYPDSNAEKESITLSFSYGLTRVIPEDTLNSALQRADVELLKMKKSSRRAA